MNYMTSEIVNFIQKNFIKITNHSVSKNYIEKFLIPLIKFINNNSSNSFLLSGSQGVGKTTRSCGQLHPAVAGWWSLPHRHLGSQAEGRRQEDSGFLLRSDPHGYPRRAGLRAPEAFGPPAGSLCPFARRAPRGDRRARRGHQPDAHRPAALGDDDLPVDRIGRGAPARDCRRWRAALRGDGVPQPQPWPRIPGSVSRLPVPDRHRRRSRRAPATR